MHILFGLSDLDTLDLMSKDPVLSCGQTGAWDSGLVTSLVPIEIDNKLCIYYSGRRTSHTASDTSKIASAFGRAWLRKDGFVSFTGGTLITEPFTLTERELRVNARGDIHAVLYDGTEASIASGEFSGDDINARVLEITPPASGPCHIEFDCRNGELFSSWFE